MSQRGLHNFWHLRPSGPYSSHSQDLYQIIESDISSGKGVLAIEDSSAGIPAEAFAPCIFIQTSNTTPIQQVISGTYTQPDLEGDPLFWEGEFPILVMILWVSVGDPLFWEGE